MANKIAVTKQGFNVLTETDPDNINYSSDYDTLKYYASGNITVTPSGADAEVTLNHNLGYVPYFTAYVDSFAGAPGTNYNMCPGKFVGIPGYLDADVYADDDKIYFKIHTDYNTSSFDFRYFIFRNRLGL